MQDEEWMMEHEYAHVSPDGQICGSMRWAGVEATLSVMNEPEWWVIAEKEMWALNTGAAFDAHRGGSISREVALKIQTREIENNGDALNWD